MSYVADVWRYRYFWVHLALSDLRARFRRSNLGLLWVPLHPLLLTLIIAGVLHFVFGQEFASFAIYVFSGLILWDFLTSCINFGATSYLSAEGHVKQIRLPMAIYPIKAALYSLIIFSLSLAGFALFVLVVDPSLFSWHWLFIVPAIGMLLLLGIPLAILSAIINIKFRDFQQFIGLVLQIVWYASPVFLPRHVFDNPLLAGWTQINPVAALVDMFRMPVIDGALPALVSYAVVLLWAAFFWLLAIRMLHKNERRIVFFY